MAILGLWDDENLERIEQEQRSKKQQDRATMKEQMRKDHEEGFRVGGHVDNSKSYEYRCGQQAREETPIEQLSDEYFQHTGYDGKLHVVDKLPWYKRFL